MNFKLTNDQIKALKDINNDIGSQHKMFRLLQGDVGSGKTIVALISSLNIIESGYQVAFMAPTEILASQYYNLAKKIFPKNINIEILSNKIHTNKKKIINSKLIENKINIVFGTHAIFQKKSYLKILDI